MKSTSETGCAPQLRHRSIALPGRAWQIGDRGEAGDPTPRVARSSPRVRCASQRHCPRAVRQSTAAATKTSGSTTQGHLERDRGGGQSHKGRSTGLSPGNCSYPGSIRGTVHPGRPLHTRDDARARAMVMAPGADERRQTACKPGSVPASGCLQAVAHEACGGGGGHSSGAPVARRLMRPTRAAARRPAWRSRTVPVDRSAGAGRSYLVLLPVGFSVPPPLPAARCALAAPFHPCRPPAGLPRSGSAVSFLWHFPWGCPRRALPGTAPPWSPDFPLPADGRERPPGRLTLADVDRRRPVVKGASCRRRWPARARCRSYLRPPRGRQAARLKCRGCRRLTGSWRSRPRRQTAS